VAVVAGAAAVPGSCGGVTSCGGATKALARRKHYRGRVNCGAGVTGDSAAPAGLGELPGDRVSLLGNRVTRRQQRRLILLIAIVNVGSVLGRHPHGTAGWAGQVLAVALAGAQIGALWWVNRRPGWATAVAAAGDAGLILISSPSPSVLSIPGMSLILLCYLAWLRPAKVSLWGLAGVAVMYGVLFGWSGRWDRAALEVSLAVLFWSWGVAGRARSQRRRSQVRQAQLEERARIAREVHDVVAHSVSVMVVQAAAADDVFDLDPVQARKAIRQVELAGRQALVELRWFLRTVRAAGADAHEQAEDQADLDAGDGPDDGPQPSLAGLDRLATTMSDAALRVSVRREGEGYDEVPRTLGLNAYRIVQESLTNTLRHADADQVEVLLRLTDDQLRIDISDDGRHGGARPGDRPSGHGLLGMRERATLLGGSLTAGPRPSGGWLVTAQFPLKGSI